MKVSVVFAFLTVVSFFVVANASANGNVGVFATEQSKGSMSIGDKSAYTKTFDVTLVKLSSGAVDLSKLCLKVFSPDNHVFRLDTVDEMLSSGSLEDGKPVKGMAVFSSENYAVLTASLVKISEDCK